MAITPDKQRCALPGCRAWAKRGESLCASHLRSTAVGRHAREVLPLLRAASRPSAPSSGPDAEAQATNVEVIDRELEELLEARRYFRRWVEEQRQREERGDPPADDGPKALTPAQFMQAWNGTTMRVIQLIKARRELLGGAGTSASEALIQDVMDEVARGLPGDLPDAPPPGAAVPSRPDAGEEHG